MQIKKFLIACLSFITFMSQAQQEPARVSFTVKNPSLKNKMLDFKSFDGESKIIAGYGYSLNALASHATNMPVPVYVFEENNGIKELRFVVTKADNGKIFSMNQKYEISREQYLDAANGEMKLKNTEKAKENNSIESIAARKALKLFSISLKGASILPKQAYIRYELPWGSDKAIGFSSTMNKFSRNKITLPIGTKVYQCSGKYWERDSKHTEELLVIIQESIKEETISLK